MYIIPKKINLASLKNEIVSHISFGIDYILLVFSNNSIQISGGFLFKFNGQVEVKGSSIPC